MPVYFWTEYEIITNYGTLKSKHKRQKIKIGKHAHTQKKNTKQKQDTQASIKV